MRLRRCGADAVLVEFDSLTEVSAARAALADVPDVVDLVPAARTVLVTFVPGSGGTRLVRDTLAGVDLTTPPPLSTRVVVFPVVYDGPDLDLVASTAGLSRAEVVALHSGAEYTVAFTGFVPGFGYLTGLPPALRQSRLDSPRAQVAAGAVGLAGEFTGVYPRSSPGGWRLLAHLAEDATPLFDSTRDPAALLSPGDQVRFEALS
ncbi:MAG: allophanate hydrolase subunit 1 [Actinomycetota bacterium]|nr:allophanate hydrolase subunit 1 [Actinomycetota bacterium]